MTREENPLCTPKDAVDDPNAPKNIDKLLNSRAYARADRDLALLSEDALRPVRLQLEYLKPELALTRQAVKSTIVVFGGTRIVEPAAAKRQVQACEADLEKHGPDEGKQARLRIAKRVLAKSHYYDVARGLAELVSLKNPDPGEWVITTGGGPGIMEAANRGAYDAGANSIGLNITLPMEQFPNPYISPELCFQFRYFALRKLHFLQRAKALIAFPGGFGTFDELFEALCLVQTRTIKRIPIVLVGKDFWKQAFDGEFLRDEGVISPQDLELFSYAETAPEVWDAIEPFL